MNHKKEKTPCYQEYYWMCSTCLEVFDNQSEFRLHKDREAALHTFGCPADGCKNILVTRHHLTRHVWEVHHKKIESLCKTCEMWGEWHEKCVHNIPCTWEGCTLAMGSSDMMWRHIIKRHGYGRCVLIA